MNVETAYGYTGEVYDTYIKLIYLRSRYYASGTGRFLTRDTWGGDANSPLSFNRWNYVHSNPLNYVDPSGHKRNSCLPGDPSQNIEYIESNSSFFSKSSVLDTYTAAGIAVQCWRDYGILDWGKTLDPRYDENYAGFGPGQITNIQVQTPYGVEILDDESHNRGFGLLCYIIFRRSRDLRKYVPCTFCAPEEEVKRIFGEGNYSQESVHDQSEMKWAVEYMRRRIHLVMTVCKSRNCGDTDMFIAAALAQNGPGFTQFSMGEKELKELSLIDQTKDVKMDWGSWFEGGDPINTSTQLWRFNQAIKGLTAKNWFIPYIDTIKIDNLINGRFHQ